MASDQISLDHLAADIVRRSGLRFIVAQDAVGRDVAFGLRYRAVVEQQWDAEIAMSDGRERDAYDDRAVHVIGWDGDTPVATGRIVLPPGTLPTEEVCGIRIEPSGRVADVGRMTVAQSHQAAVGHAAFLALLARLYLEVHSRQFEAACGIMSARARSLVRFLGLKLEVLGADRPYWGEPRAPVRFEMTMTAASLVDRWR